MSIIGNAYKLSNSPLTISRHNTRVYDCGRIDGSIAYPPCQSILASVSAEQGAGNALEECYHRDALFGFAIRSHLDCIARRGRIANDPVLDRIVRIRLYDWSGLDCQGGGKQPPIQIRYAAVMGMQLWKRINVLSNQVSFFYHLF